MNARILLHAFILAALPFGAVAIGCAASTNNGGDGSATCSSVCANTPACSQAAGTCEAQCGQLQTACSTAGHGGDFQAFLDCAASATYACSSAGVPQTSSCGAQSGTLEECGSSTPPPTGTPDGGMSPPQVDANTGAPDTAPATTPDTSTGETCDTCQMAAQATGGACVAQATACSNNTSCVDLNMCLSACMDQTCANNCATQDQAGVTDLNAFDDCICSTACATPCASECM